MQNEEKSFWRNVWLVIAVTLAMWGPFLLKEFAGLDVTPLANSPRSVQGLPGILLSPFIHGSWEHILSNSLPLMVLLFVVLNAFPAAAWRVWLFIHLGSGVLLWLLGTPGTLHIGASGVVYGLAFFLFASAFFRSDRTSTLIAIFVVILYGTMAEGFIPKTGVSWQSHLYGALCGVAAAFLFRGLDVREEKTHEAEPEEEHFFIAYEKWLREKEAEAHQHANNSEHNQSFK